MILLALFIALNGLASGILILHSQSGSNKAEKLADPIVIEKISEEPEINVEIETEPQEEPQQTEPEEEQTQENKEESPASGNIQECQARLEQLVNTEYGAGGSVAVCAGRTGESDMAMVNGGAMQAASLIKLYVAGCVYENYGAVSALETYSGETESLLKSMITVSDNSACNTLVTRLGSGSASSGMALVNQYSANHGFSDTHMGRLMLQPNDVDDNYTSVRDCCTFLKMANAGQLQGSESILSYMGQQERRGKIPAGLPSGVSSGNKTGELDDVENDAAIVYAGSGTYVLCVMSENLADTYSSRQFIARTSSVVYEMMQ